MKRILFVIPVLLTGLISCKKELVEESNSLVGLWEIVQTETTHELGHYGPYDPPVREIDSRQTLIINHQNVFSTLDVSSNLLT